MIIGRFQKNSEMTREKLVKIVRSKQELKGIPVIADADFGHTTPQFTFPIGGRGTLSAVHGKVSFTIVEH
jgi:muramoyltetrapeptide carboxypeptidase LdcA involved in peptidoglycan recycling